MRLDGTNVKYHPSVGLFHLFSAGSTRYLPNLQLPTQCLWLSGCFCPVVWMWLDGGEPDWETGLLLANNTKKPGMLWALKIRSREPHGDLIFKIKQEMRGPVQSGEPNGDIKKRPWDLSRLVVKTLRLRCQLSASEVLSCYSCSVFVSRWRLATDAWDSEITALLPHLLLLPIAL